MMKSICHALILAAGLLACSEARAQQLKVGVILPLSGEVSSFGMACQNAMQLAVKDLDSSLASRLTVVYEDDAFHSSQTVASYQKLKNADKVNAIVTYSSSSSNAVAPLAESDKLIDIALASDPGIVNGRKHVFLLWVTPKTEADVVASEMKRRGYKKIASIVAEQDGMLAITDEINRASKEHVQIVLHEEYPVSVKDFRPFLGKLKSIRNLDGVYIGLLPDQNAIFAKQARQLGISLPLFNVETVEDPSAVKLAEGALNGTWYVQADDPSADFLRRFQAAYPDSSLYSASYCYDTIGLIADSLRQNKPLKEYLRTVKDYNGASGTLSASGDQRFLLPATVKIVTERGFEKQQLK